jgi:hypothetical protein
MNYQGRALRYGSALSGGYQPHEPRDINELYLSGEIGIREAGKLINHFLTSNARRTILADQMSTTKGEDKKLRKTDQVNVKRDLLESLYRSGHVNQQLAAYIDKKIEQGLFNAQSLEKARAAKMNKAYPRKPKPTKYRYATSKQGKRYRAEEIVPRAKRVKKVRKQPARDFPDDYVGPYGPYVPPPKKRSRAPLQQEIMSIEEVPLQEGAGMRRLRKGSALSGGRRRKGASLAGAALSGARRLKR